MFICIKRDEDQSYLYNKRKLGYIKTANVTWPLKKVYSYYVHEVKHTVSEKVHFALCSFLRHNQLTELPENSFRHILYIFRHAHIINLWTQ